MFKYNQLTLTLLTYEVEGWCLTGMKNSLIRSKNWMPSMELIPIYRNTPNNTDMGTSRNSGDMSTDTPTRMATVRALTRCSFTSTRCGFSPGAWVRDITVTADTCATERTVAAQIHGVPRKPQPTLSKQTSTMSRWKPEPLRSLRSFLSIISLLIHFVWDYSNLKLMDYIIR